jgi:hypothetical protein
MGIAACSVQEQNGVIGMASAIAVCCAECEIVKPQFGKGFARSEREILDDKHAVLDGPFGLTLWCLRTETESCNKGDGEANNQRVSLSGVLR